MKVKFDDGTHALALADVSGGVLIQSHDQGLDEGLVFDYPEHLVRFAEFLLKVARKHPAFN